MSNDPPPTPHAGAPTCTVSGLNGSRVNVRFKSTRTRLAATGSPAYVLRSAALAVLGRAFAGDAPRRLGDDAPSLDGAGVASDVSSGSSGDGTKAGLLVYDWLARLPAGVRCTEASMAARPVGSTPSSGTAPDWPCVPWCLADACERRDSQPMGDPTDGDGDGDGPGGGVGELGNAVCVALKGLVITVVSNGGDAGPRIAPPSPTRATCAPSSTMLTPVHPWRSCCCGRR